MSLKLCKYCKGTGREDSGRCPDCDGNGEVECCDDCGTELDMNGDCDNCSEEEGEE